MKINPYAVDRRGKHNKSKTSVADIEFFNQFVRSIPCYESEIGTNPSSKKYLHPSLSVTRIYQLYENNCILKEKKVLSMSVFTKLFKSNFCHLQQFKSGKSSCSICQSICEQRKKKVLSPELLEQINQIENDHFEALRNMKSEFMHSAEIGVDVFTFELQNPLDIPMLPVNESYDLKPLWLSNLCIFDEVRKIPYMFVWNETTAKRGPEEVGSCLLKHIINTISNDTKKVILYSDSTGLYRNAQVAMMLRNLFDNVNIDLQSIELRFFSQGHSKNDCNACFDLIDKKLKTSESLFTPDDWIQFISSIKQLKRNFNVIKMSSDDFFSAGLFMQHEIFEKINWSDVKSIIYDRSELLNLRLNYFSRDSEEIVPIDKQNYELLMAYNKEIGNAISKAKHDDLINKTLKYIPSEKHPYYETLQLDDSPIDEDFAFASYD